MAVARQRITLPRASWREAMRGMCNGRLWEGEEVAEFEREFADFVGVPDAVAVPSGRAGLRFIFDALDLEPGDEIICSAFNYPIVPYLAKTLGYAVRFVDCELTSLGPDPEQLAAAMTDKTRVVVAAHLYGIPCRIREIVEIADRHGASVVEDCAHCYGAAVGERKTGAFGRAAYFSFETSKPINTLGGGMITTTEDAFATRVRGLRETESPKKVSWLLKRLAKTSFEATATHPVIFNAAVYPALRFAPRRKGAEDRLASGYDGDAVSMQGKMGRYTNFQARLGRAQMARVAAGLERRVHNAERLIGQLKDHVQFQQPNDPEARANYMLVTALIDRMPEVSACLLRMGVDTKHHYMRDCSSLLDTGETFPNAARAEKEVLHIPAYPQLSDAQIDKIAEKVKVALKTVVGA